MIRIFITPLCTLALAGGGYVGPQLRQVGVSEESEERVEEASQTQQERHGHNLLVATCVVLLLVGQVGIYI